MSPADRWTLTDVADHYARHPELRHPEPSIMPLTQPTDGAGETLARMRVSLPVTPVGFLEATEGQKQASPFWPYRSKTEQQYAALLDQWQREEDIARWWYEPMKLWLAPRTTITIDFLVRRYGGERLELHEVKGKWIREDGWVKLKIAAALYPCYLVILATWKENAWHWKTVPAI